MTQLPNVIPQTAFPGQVRDALLLTDGVQVQRPGAAIQITASVAGEVTLKLWGENDIIVTVSVGDSIYPYQVVMATSLTATITRYYNLFT